MLVLSATPLYNFDLLFHPIVMSILKTKFKEILKSLDLAVMRQSTLEALLKKATASDVLDMLLAFPPHQRSTLISLLPNSKSQLRQDLFVLSQLEFKTDGYFVEFGATNGVDWSNTFLLEKLFGWKGILAEPARVWHPELDQRRSAHIEKRCVWRDSTSTLTFTEAESAELSTISSYNNSDSHRLERKKGVSYQVSTVSLNDMLAQYDAPKEIDYLSIDTEGSEFEILSC